MIQDDDHRHRYLELLAQRVLRPGDDADQAVADAGVRLGRATSADLEDWFELELERSRFIAAALRSTVSNRDAIAPGALGLADLRSLRANLRELALGLDQRGLELEQRVRSAARATDGEIITRANALAGMGAYYELRAVARATKSDSLGDDDVDVYAQRLDRGLRALRKDSSDPEAAVDVTVGHAAVLVAIRFARGKALVCRDAAANVDRAIELERDAARAKRLDRYAGEYAELDDLVCDLAGSAAVELADAEADEGAGEECDDDDGPWEDHRDPDEQAESSSAPSPWEEAPKTYSGAIADGLWSGAGHAVASVLLGIVFGAVLGWSQAQQDTLLDDIASAIVFGIIGMLVGPSAWGCVVALQAAVKVYRLNEPVGLILFGSLSALLAGALLLCWGTAPIASIVRHGPLVIFLACGVGLTVAAFTIFVLTVIAFGIAVAFPSRK